MSLKHRTKIIGAASGLMAAGLIALTAPAASANIDDVLAELGGKVISTTDTVIEEIGGGTAGAPTQDVIIEEYVYVTGAVEDYLPPVTNAPAPVPAPAPINNVATSANSGYVAQAPAPVQSWSSTWAAPSLANTGAYVIPIAIVAGLALLGGVIAMIVSRNKKAKDSASE